MLCRAFFKRERSLFLKSIKEVVGLQYYVELIVELLGDTVRQWELKNKKNIELYSGGQTCFPI